jgi:anti-anti-sigma factor
MNREAFEICPLAWDYGLRVSGELDALTAPMLAEALTELDLDEEIVLDLEELTFIDSVGVQTLLSFARSLNGTALVIANPSPAIVRVLEILRLERIRGVEIRTDDAAANEVAPR